MDSEDYMRQAGMTAAAYLDAGVLAIDDKFGDGYAEKNPSLVGAFMISSALDYLACSGAKEITDSIEYLSTKVADAIEG